MKNYAKDAVRLKIDGAPTDNGSYRTEKPGVYSGRKSIAGVDASGQFAANTDQGASLTGETDAPVFPGYSDRPDLLADDMRRSYPDIEVLPNLLTDSRLPAAVVKAHQGQGIDDGTDNRLNEAVGGEVCIEPSLVESREK